MATRKVSTGNATRPTVINLEEDEQLVEEVTTIKKTGRQRRPKIADDEPITVEPITDDDDDDPPDDEPVFSDTSLAAILYGGDGGGSVENEVCNVHVRRNPDSMKDNFIVPCSAVTSLPRISNVSLATDREDIEDRVRSDYGGGHYHFQIFYNGRLGKSWTATFQDGPEHRRRAEVPAAETVASNAPPPAPVDPMSSLINNLKQTAQLRELLFGDTEKQLRDEIDRLRAEADKKPEPETVTSEEFALWKMASGMPDSEAKSRLLDKLTPTDDAGNRHWIADVISVVAENKDTIGGLIGPLLGLGSAPAPTQTSIADMMRQAPPTLPAPDAPSVRRKPVATNKPAAEVSTRETTELSNSESYAASEAEPFVGTPITPERVAELSEFADDIAPVETDEAATDATAKDAEIIDEVKNEPAKPKRGRKAAV